jgi:hypothetical protein
MADQLLAMGFAASVYIGRANIRRPSPKPMEVNTNARRHVRIFDVQNFVHLPGLLSSDQISNSKPGEYLLENAFGAGCLSRSPTKRFQIIPKAHTT